MIILQDQLRIDDKSNKLLTCFSSLLHETKAGKSFAGFSSEPCDIRVATVGRGNSCSRIPANW